MPELQTILTYRYEGGFAGEEGDASRPGGLSYGIASRPGGLSYGGGHRDWEERAYMQGSDFCMMSLAEIVTLILEVAMRFANGSWHKYGCGFASQ